MGMTLSLDTPVCVTGIGVMTAFGNGIDVLRQGYEKTCEIQGTASQNGGSESRHLMEKPRGAEYFSDRLGINHLSKAAISVCATTKCALEDAKIDLKTVDRSRVVVAIGSAFASANAVCEFSKQLHDEGPGGIEPLMFPNTVSN